MKLKGATNASEPGAHVYLFWCPGCHQPHPYRIKRVAGEGPEVPIWSFNGDMERPTFTPSLLVDQGGPERCHLFLMAGQLQFCSDSHHSLAGKTVPCPDWDEEKW